MAKQSESSILLYSAGHLVSGAYPLNLICISLKFLHTSPWETPKPGGGCRMAMCPLPCRAWSTKLKVIHGLQGGITPIDAVSKSVTAVTTANFCSWPVDQCPIAHAQRFGHASQSPSVLPRTLLDRLTNPQKVPWPFDCVLTAVATVDTAPMGVPPPPCG